jgi:molybdopterin-guanine dinucleotide biosynthesis protein A
MSETISTLPEARSSSHTLASRLVPAIVLAGDKRGSHPVFGVNKNLLEVGGEPLVRHVVRTLLDVEGIDAIYAVGPQQEIERALDGIEYPTHRPVHVVRQRETIVQNCWQGLRRALGADGSADLEALKVDHADAVALVLPGDLPFLDPAEVRYLLQHADMEHYDYVLGLTPIEALDRVVHEAEVPELRKPALHMAEGRVRQNNLHLIRPPSRVLRPFLRDALPEGALEHGQGSLGGPAGERRHLPAGRLLPVRPGRHARGSAWLRACRRLVSPTCAHGRHVRGDQPLQRLPLWCAHRSRGRRGARRRL